METTNKQNSFLRTYKKNQLSTLSRSLIIAGIGFVLICLIGFLSYFLISKFIQTNNAQGLFALLISSTILVFVSLIMSIVV
jgi:preprotein translocase subunit Sss1